MTARLLDVRGLEVSFGRRHPTRVLAGVDLSVRAGEILGVIGETGSGKTTLARAIVGLAPVRSGRITFEGTELTGLRGRARYAFRRAGRLQLTFQDPLRALDPQWTVARVVGEGVAPPDRAGRVTEALHRVGLDPSLAGRTPGEISGGQRQRVLLARALATRPRLLLCDEPVSALDASNRNHVLRLLDQVRTDAGVAVVVISHDLSSLAGIADRVAVLYRGRIVEEGPIRDVLDHPGHPYTALLVASAPSLGRPHGAAAARLRPDPDRPLWTHPAGCVFADRCRFATDACAEEPVLTDMGRRRVACHHATHWRKQLVQRSNA
jgi:oligopeptide/dipeptide ABC transporter ATP-binding protein